jgi:hypothetical protein
MKEAGQRPQQINRQEQGRTHDESSANIPSAHKIWTEQQDWYERPHEELVKAFQNYVQERVQANEGQFSPAEIIAGWLRFGHRLDRKIEDLYSQLRLAWDALAFDYYTPSSRDDFRAGEVLHNQYIIAKGGDIKLSDPLQIKVIDVLTEAIGIPHQKGQSVIKIPGKLEDYLGWIESKENEERLNTYLREREAKKTKSVPTYN